MSIFLKLSQQSQVRCARSQMRPLLNSYEVQRVLEPIKGETGDRMHSIHGQDTDHVTEGDHKSWGVGG